MKISEQVFVAPLLAVVFLLLMIGGSGYVIYQDKKICDKIIASDEASESDKEFCVATKALKRNNWKMCNTISTPETRDYCVIKVIVLNKLDSKLCDNAGSRKEQCYAYSK